MQFLRRIFNYFDKLEDKIRRKLSHYPILYAFIGGIGVVMFWRGVWHSADFVSEIIFSVQQNTTIDLGNLPWWDGPLSLVVGSLLLLSTGLFVFDFIGNELIVSGLKGEKKIAEKTEDEIRIDTSVLSGIKEEVENISDRLDEIEKKI